MTGFLGLGRRRVAGVGVSAVFLLASCTKVVSSHGVVDSVALTSYLSSSSSSVASVSSASASKAAAAKQAICSDVIIGFAQVSTAWSDFVTALNNGTASGEQVDPLREALHDGSAKIKSADADPGSDLGKAAGAYADALDALANLFTKQQISVNDMNTAHGRVNSTVSALMDVCGI